MQKTAKKLNIPVSHIILHGKPGYGKTTIAYYISEQIGTKFHHLIGPKIAIKDLCMLVLNLEEKDIVFIDEIHALGIEVEEFLYPVIEEFKLLYKNRQFDVKPFTMIGATTNIGRISKPLLDRFIYKLHLDEYTEKELTEISEKKAEKFSISLTPEGHKLVVDSSKNTPRIINNLILAMRDHIVSENTEGNTKAVESVLESLDIKDGLGGLDRAYLKLMSHTPIGLNQISNMLGVDSSVVENTIEPYLIEKKLINKTSRGRVKTFDNGDLDEIFNFL